MTRSKAKRKSMRKAKAMGNSRWYCDCYYCVGDDWRRFVRKTRVRKKFFKYPQKMTLPDE